MYPKVSVVVATYRRTESLKHALESLISQTYQHFEIIVVDDNDDAVYNDYVEKIVAEIKTLQPETELRLIVNHPNLGSARARNAGICAATGELVTFLDDDDLYLPEKIKQQVAHMCQVHSDYSITDLDLYHTSEKLVERRTRSYIRNMDQTHLLQYHFMYHMTGTDTMMFKREYLNQIGGFDVIDVGDEFYLMKKAITGGGKFSYLNRCDVKAYVHASDSGLSSGQSKIDGENQLYLFKQKYFCDMDKQTIRYINMRHHAVLAFAYIRLKRYGSFLSESFQSFFCSPLACIKLFLNLK